MFTTFAPKAIHTAQVVLFPPKATGHRRFIFGSIGFWVIFGLIIYVLFLARFVLMAALVVLILVAQLALWIVESPFVLGLKISDRRSSRVDTWAGKRWDAR